MQVPIISRSALAVLVFSALACSADRIQSPSVPGLFPGPASLRTVDQNSPQVSDARVVGGGVVDGPLGLTSQLGIGATSAGGSFQCVMAGRSGGFPFAAWSQVLQMEVHGNVTPGSLTINSDGSATFSGKAHVQVVGRDATGKILRADFSDIDYNTTHTAGGPGVATHQLNVVGLGLVFGPTPLKSGRITIVP
jgi:hypothetical protein